MIKTRTVLVLGAGSSIDFGFPSGPGLLERVLQDLRRSDSTIKPVLSTLGFADALIQDFAKTLRMARTPSIDSFVEHRTDFLEIGKACIACGLIPRESWPALFKIGGRSWYDYLLGLLTDQGPEHFSANKLAIVTFNYDRSLDYYLFTTLQNRWHLSTEECARLLRSVPVVHVYGQLGKLPELAEGEGRPYGASLTEAAVRESVAAMEILHEAKKDSPRLRQAIGLLSSADRVIFLGFGYHPTNLDRLAVSDLINRDVYGSAFGLLMGELHPIRVAFGNVPIDLGKENEDTLLFLRSRAILQ